MHRQYYYFTLRTITLGLIILLQCGLGVLNATDRQIALEKNSAMPLKLETDVQEIFVANPEIADIQQNSPKIAYIYGKKAGTTTIFATDISVKVTTINLTVTHNLSQFNNVMKSLYPGEQISAISSPAGIILAGSISTSKVRFSFRWCAKIHWLIPSWTLGLTQFILVNCNSDCILAHFLH